MNRADQDTVTLATLRRVIVAASLGNLVEWFDFGIYGFLASSLTKVFFPDGDATTALLKTFAVFAVAFALRPIGGIYFGSLGDRIGRKKTLAITILLMGTSTMLMGFLPSYASVGLWAPALLIVLRSIQGLSAGGEYAGACAYVVEHCPQFQRARYASYLPISTFLSFVLAGLVSFVLHSFISDASMTSWGWRIPFLVAGPFGFVGVYLRMKLGETPAFQPLEARADLSHSPLIETLRSHSGTIVALVLFISAAAVAFVMFAVYLSTYLQVAGKMSAPKALSINVLSCLFAAAMAPLLGRISDFVGRRTTMMVACVWMAASVFPAYMMAGTGNYIVSLAGLCLFSISVVLCLVVTAVLLSEVFPTRTRYTASAIAYNAAYTLFGGTAPLIATYLIGKTGNSLSPAYYLIAVAVFGVVGCLFLPETSRIALNDDLSIRGSDETHRKSSTDRKFV